MDETAFQGLQDRLTPARIAGAAPAILLNLGIGGMVIATLLRVVVTPAARPLWLTAWVGVAVAFILLGLGVVGWSGAVEPGVGLLFLWGTTLAGLITLAGAAAAFVPSAHLFGSSALVFLAAVLAHLHLVFPVEVAYRWRWPAVVLLYTLAGMLATAWVLRPDLPHLRAISRGYFVVALGLAWARMVGIGRWWGIGLEEKWTARWLAIVLAAGGLLPAASVLAAELVAGRAVLPLAVAYVLELAVPLGYLPVLRRYGRGDVEIVPVERVSVAAGLLTGTILMAIAGLGLGTAARPVERWGMVALLVSGAYPLFRGVGWWLAWELYGGWYRRERVLRELADRLSGMPTVEAVWPWVARCVAVGVGARWTCVEVAGQRYRWQVAGRDAAETAVLLEVPVRVRGEERARLRLGSPLGRKGYTPWERRWVEAVARLVGMRLAWEEREAEVRRLRAVLAARREGARAVAPCPLSEREIEILALVAAGKSDQEIADEMHLSRKTVESHLQNIYRKLGVGNRTAAVAIAVGEGWIEPPEWYRGTRGNP